MPKGYEKKHGGRVISLCSAPDWCGTLKNPGAVLLIDRSSMRMYVLLRANSCRSHCFVQTHAHGRPHCSPLHSVFCLRLHRTACAGCPSGAKTFTWRTYPPSIVC